MEWGEFLFSAFPHAFGKKAGQIHSRWLVCDGTAHVDQECVQKWASHSDWCFLLILFSSKLHVITTLISNTFLCWTGFSLATLNPKDRKLLWETNIQALFLDTMASGLQLENTAPSFGWYHHPRLSTKLNADVLETDFPFVLILLVEGSPCSFVSQESYFKPL